MDSKILLLKVVAQYCASICKQNTNEIIIGICIPVYDIKSAHNLLFKEIVNIARTNV